MDSISLNEAIDFATTIGREAADLARAFLGTEFGMFLVGVWLLAALARAVWGKVRRG